MINVPYASATTNPLLHASRLFGAELSTQTNPTVEPPKSLLMRAPVQSSHAISLVVMKEVVKALGYSNPGGNLAVHVVTGVEAYYTRGSGYLQCNLPPRESLGQTGANGLCKNVVCRCITVVLVRTTSAMCATHGDL